MSAAGESMEGQREQEQRPSGLFSLVVVLAESMGVMFFSIFFFAGGGGFYCFFFLGGIYEGHESFAILLIISDLLIMLFLL